MEVERGGSAKLDEGMLSWGPAIQRQLSRSALHRQRKCGHFADTTFLVSAPTALRLHPIVISESHPT